MSSLVVIVVRIARLAAVVLPVLFAGIASAQPSKSAAEALYDEAWDAMSRGDYTAACSKFEASYRVDQATGPLQGLARCEEKRGHPARALEDWRQLLARLPPQSPSRPEAEANVQRLEGLVATVVLTLAPGAPTDTRVELDAVVVAADGSRRAVDPDVDHTLRASARGFVDHTVTVKLGSGETKPVVLAPIAPAVAATTPTSSTTAPEPPLPPRGGGLRTAGFIVGGIGIASAVVAVITGAIMLDAQSDVSGACKDRARCADVPKAREAASRGEDLAVLNAVTFAGAVVGIGAGVTLVIVGGPSGGAGGGATGARTGFALARRF